MSILKKLFALSLEKDVKKRLLFWGIIVVINANMGIYMAFTFSKISVIASIFSGICIWIIIYGLFLGPLYQKLGETGHKKLQISLFIAYCIKTLYSVLWIFGFFIGLIFDIRLGVVNKLLGLLEIGAMYSSFTIIDSLGIDLIESDLFLFYLTTISGLILSIFTLIFGLLLYPIVSRYFRKFHSNSENPTP